MRLIATMHSRHDQHVAVFEIGTTGSGANFCVRATFRELPVVVHVEGIARQLDATRIAEKLADDGVLAAMLDLMAPKGIVPDGARVTLELIGPQSRAVAIAEVRALAPRLGSTDPEISASERDNRGKCIGEAQKGATADGDPGEGQRIVLP